MRKALSTQQSRLTAASTSSLNNSGVYEGAPLEAITEDHFHKIFNVNVLGLFLTTQAASKHLGEGASIINIGSVVSSLTPANWAVYTGTKGAVDAITGVLTRELARLRRFDRLLAVESGFFGEKALINQRQHLQKRLRCRPTPLQAL